MVIDKIVKVIFIMSKVYNTTSKKDVYNKKQLIVGMWYNVFMFDFSLSLSLSRHFNSSNETDFCVFSHKQ